MADLLEEYANNEPLMVIRPDGLTPVIAGLVVLESNGKNFVGHLDPFWDEVSAFPEHFIRGKITGGGPWKVGNSRIDYH